MSGLFFWLRFPVLYAMTLGMMCYIISAWANKSGVHPLIYAGILILFAVTSYQSIQLFEQIHPDERGRFANKAGLLGWLSMSPIYLVSTYMLVQWLTTSSYQLDFGFWLNALIYLIAVVGLAMMGALTGGLLELTSRRNYSDLDLLPVAATAAMGPVFAGILPKIWGTETYWWLFGLYIVVAVKELSKQLRKHSPLSYWETEEELRKEEQKKAKEHQRYLNSPEYKKLRADAEAREKAEQAQRRKAAEEEAARRRKAEQQETAERQERERREAEARRVREEQQRRREEVERRAAQEQAAREEAERRRQAEVFARAQKVRVCGTCKERYPESLIPRCPKCQTQHGQELEAVYDAVAPGSEDFKDMEELLRQVQQKETLGDFIGAGNAFLDIALRLNPQQLWQAVPAAKRVVATQFDIPTELEYELPHRDRYLPHQLHRTADDYLPQLMTYAYVLGATRRTLPPPHDRLLNYYLYLAEEQRSELQRLAETYAEQQRGKTLYTVDDI